MAPAEATRFQGGTAQLSPRRSISSATGGMAAGCAIAGLALAITVTFAYRAGRSDGLRDGNRQGACITMDMAMALGFLDDPGRRLVTRSLSSGLNPYYDRFEGGHGALLETCADIAHRRWSPQRIAAPR